jgi:hypothetical protein
MARSARLAVVVIGGVAGACDQGRDGAAPPPTEAQATGAPPLAGKPFYRVDAGPVAPCSAGATCEAKLVLTALGDYKVNDEYPTKFVPDERSELDVDGHTFAIDGNKRGTLTVRFTPQKPGEAKLVGTFKLSVCNEDNCEIEAPQITLTVTSS